MASIVIANWDGGEVFRRCLESLKLPSDADFELIVIDNGSRDGSWKFVKEYFPRATLIRNETNLGFSKGYNQGMRLAKGDYILLLNNDIEVSEGWLGKFLKNAQSDAEIGVAGCGLRQPDGSRGSYRNRLDLFAVIANEEKPGSYCDAVGGAALLVSRKAVEKIGYLDEYYTPAYYEDSDYCLRARRAGLRVAYFQEPVLFHIGMHTTGRMPADERFRLLTRNRLRFVIVNFPMHLLLLRLPIELFIAVRNSILKGMFGFHARLAIGTLAGLGRLIDERLNPYRR